MGGYQQKLEIEPTPPPIAGQDQLKIMKEELKKLIAVKIEKAGEL